MEKPTMEQPTTEIPSEPAAPSAPNPHAELLGELEKFGVKNAEQLQGKLAAAQQVGNMGNVLGEVRRENEELKRFIKEQMQQQRQAPAKRDDWNAPPQEAGTIDIQDLVKKSVQDSLRSALMEEKQNAMRQQEQVLKAYHKITGDPDFPIVKDQWEAKLKDPNFALQLQAGAVDPVAEYQELLRDAYKSAIRKSADIIKNLTVSPTSPKVHVEGQARIGGRPEVSAPDKDKHLAPLREKVNKGKKLSEEEELSALMKVLGGGA